MLVCGVEDKGTGVLDGDGVSRLEFGLGLLVPRLGRVVSTCGRHICWDLPALDSLRMLTFMGASWKRIKVANRSRNATAHRRDAQTTGPHSWVPAGNEPHVGD